MPNRLAVCGLALLTAVLVAGCGGDDQPKADAPSSQASPTAPPGLDATEPPRPEDQSNSSASAVEYARWFAQLVQYGIETRNSRVISSEAFDQAGCSNCRAVAKVISDLKSSGYWQLSDDLRLGPFRPTRLGGGVRVTGSFVYPEVDDVKVDGKVAKTIPASRYAYEVDLKWDPSKKTWRVLDFIFEEKKA